VRRAVVAPHVDRHLAAARAEGRHVARLQPPSRRDRAWFIDGVAIGSSASSTLRRRVMLPVCQCSSWRPVMSTKG
jgi:hypothetical protein